MPGMSSSCKLPHFLHISKYIKYNFRFRKFIEKLDVPKIETTGLEKIRDIVEHLKALKKLLDDLNSEQETSFEK